MKTRQSFFYPILGAVVAILFTIAVLVAWNIIFTQYYLLATETPNVPELGVGYWLILSAGCLFLVLIVAVLIVFLVNYLRQILLVRRQVSFIDSVTHELKSPLASISLCLETMERRDLSPEMLARFITMMRRDVTRLRNFIEHILEAGRLEHNERELEETPTVLPDLVGHCLKQLGQRYPNAPEAVQLSLDLPPTETSVLTDPVALEIVLINLLDNAVKYSEADKLDVELTLRKDGPWIEITVVDRGMGIPKKHLKRIFKRFHRVEREDKPKVKGTGLGLYVVASLVHRLGGRISADSEGEDKGSTFTVRLPFKPTREGTQREAA